MKPLNNPTDIGTIKIIIIIMSKIIASPLFSYITKKTMNKQGGHNGFHKYHQKTNYAERGE